jgi:carboxypeptidase family protein
MFGSRYAICALWWFAASSLGACAHVQPQTVRNCPPSMLDTAALPTLGTSLDTAASAGSISGRVFDAESGKALANAAIGTSAQGPFIPTDSAGAFLLTALEPGAVVLRARLIDYRVRNDTVRVPSVGGLRVSVPMRRSPGRRCEIAAF